MGNLVSFAVFESLQTKDERIIKRLIIALIICIVLAFASNALWLLAWAKNRSEDITVRGGSNANYIGRNGDIYNGAGEG